MHRQANGCLALYKYKAGCQTASAKCVQTCKLAKFSRRRAGVLDFPGFRPETQKWNYRRTEQEATSSPVLLNCSIPTHAQKVLVHHPNGRALPVCGGAHAVASHSENRKSLSCRRLECLTILTKEFLSDNVISRSRTFGCSFKLSLGNSARTALR